MIIALLAVVLLRALRIAARADDQFGMLVAAGVAIWFGVQSFINIGMTMGIMPVTGLPLPFVSYGGSAMFADMIAIGASRPSTGTAPSSARPGGDWVLCARPSGLPRLLDSG